MHDDLHDELLHDIRISQVRPADVEFLDVMLLILEEN